MKQWVRLCAVSDAPAPGQLTEANAQGRAICLANLGGELLAVDNLCPHRQGPLAEGWIEDNAVVCPWHSWAFDLKTGEATYPADQRVDAFALKHEQGDVLIEIDA